VRPCTSVATALDRAGALSFEETAVSRSGSGSSAEECPRARYRRAPWTISDELKRSNDQASVH